MWGTSPTPWHKQELAERRYITVVEDTPAARDDAPSALIAPEASSSSWGRPIQAVSSWWESKAENEDQNLVILKVPRSSVRDIDFGPHGWTSGTVYAAHPKQRGVYRAVATFYEDLLLQKITELERLINALGAREYKITHVKKAERGFSAKFDTLPVIGSRSIFGGSYGSKSTDLTERTWSGTSEGHQPWVPSDLIWIDSEPEWRNLVESRMTGTRKMFSFTVRQEEEHGVDARLAAAIKAMKLEIGGQYRSTQHVEFCVSGTF